MKNYLNSLAGISGLGALSRDAQDYIAQNATAVKRVLQRAERLNGLGELPAIGKGKSKILTMEEVIEMYNQGITPDEIRAWVWYRRSLGIPMYGWEKYFIDSRAGVDEGMLTTTEQTIIKDNRWEDIATVPAGQVLGKRIKRDYSQKSNDGFTYIIFRDAEGTKFVRIDHVKEVKSSATADPKWLDKLVRAGALYYCRGELLPLPVYTFANTYDRELDLRQDKDYIIETYGEDVYKKHEQAIQQARPTRISLLAPNPKDRPQISPVSEYAKEYMVQEMNEDTGLYFDSPVSLRYAFRKWLSTIPRTRFETNATYHDIINYYLDKRPLSRNLDKKAKEQMRIDVRNEGERLFADFLYEALSFKEQQKLELAWNREFNGFPSVNFQKIPVGFPMCRKFKGFDIDIRPAQREGVAFMEMLGSGIISYDVGVGKTITAIIELANSLQTGKCKRPLIAVPNSTFGNWCAELLGDDKNEGILTGTGITLNKWYNLGKDVLSDKETHFSDKKAVPEKSITLVTYEGFKKIGFRRDENDNFIKELAQIIISTDDKEGDGREYMKKLQKLAEMLGMGNKKTVVDIQTVGFDYIVIDEAHNFNHIFSATKKDSDGNRRHYQSVNTSDGGIKAFFLTNYLQRKFGRNIMLLTATPFNNNPLEIYSMLSLVAMNALKAEGVYNVNTFFDLFIREESEEVVTPSGQLEVKEVIKSFNNRLLLQRILYNHINYKTGEEAGVKRPQKINLPRINAKDKSGKIHRLQSNEQILTYLSMTERQHLNQREIVRKLSGRIVGYRRVVNPNTGEVVEIPEIEAPTAADILRGMGQSLDNALSPFLYEGMYPEDYNEFVEESPKIKYACEAIRSVKEWHENRGEECSGQVIYSNRGKEYFEYIRDYLIEEVGFKREVKNGRSKFCEVEILTGGASADEKDAVVQAFNEGVVKVLIGTATIREGINLQKRGTCLYNLYPDWNPTNIQQLEGRIWRQGNKYQYVRIAMPLVQDSMDVFVFQKLEEKSSRINDLWYRGNRGNVLDLESLDPEEVKYALMTDISAIALSVIKKEVATKQREISLIETNIEDMKHFNGDLQTLNYYRDKVIKENSLALENLKRFNEIIANPPSDEELKKMPATERKKIKDTLERYNNLVAESNRVLSDKELSQLSTKIYLAVNYYTKSYLDDFRQYLKKVAQAEKTILQPRGYTINDDISVVIENMQKELQTKQNELDYLNSDEHKREVEREVSQKKSAMQIAGGTLEERVEDFEKLNYLLEYPFDPSKQGSELPNTKSASKNKGGNDNKLRRMRLAEAEAVALELELELMQQSSYRNIAGLFDDLYY